MKKSDTTARFPQAFATQADSSIVAYPLPDTKQANGRVSLLNGFPLENFTALSAGGVPPSGADFNGLFRTLTEAIRANEAGQIRAFNADYAQQIGGYPQSALVCDPANPTRLLLSTQDDNKTDPASDTSGAWVSIAEGKLNRSGDTMTGDLTVLGNTSFKSPALSTSTFQQGDLDLTQPIGAAFWDMQFFLQLANNPQTKTTYGRLVLRDNGGKYFIGLQIDNYGNVTDGQGRAFLSKPEAQSTYLPLTGGSLTGGLTIKQTIDWGFGRGGGQSSLEMSDGGTERFYQQLYHQRNNLTNGVIGLSDETGDKQWRFISDGSIATPGGCVIPEVAAGTGRVLIQSFVTTADTGYTVSFPRAFSGPPTSINVDVMEASWNIGPQAGTWTKTGFQIANFSTNTAGRPQQISITAIGPA